MQVPQHLHQIETNITVIPPPTIDPIPDVCQNNGPIASTANPVGGTWSGSHVPDPDPIFRPDSGFGNPWTYYTDLNGCTDSVQSEVYAVWAGLDQSSCPGEPPFQLTNGTPVGGTWSDHSPPRTEYLILQHLEPTI